MIKRCIMIFPDFKNIQLIDNIRKKYDPLSEQVKPHITLVFPFESDIETSKLKEHIENIVFNINPFNIVLKEITPSASFGNYLFLNIKDGKDDIAEIHKRLYSGILKEFYPIWLNETKFIPHMTVGNINSDENFSKAAEETRKLDYTFETTVDKISVEVIDENENSIIEMEIML